MPAGRHPALSANHAVGKLAELLWVGVVLAIVWIIAAGVTHFSAARAFDFPPGAFHLSRGFIIGMGSAMLIATYDYWGYYNVCFLGGEVRDPGRTIPRALIISIFAVAAIYIVMNISVLGVMPWRELAQYTEAHGGFVMSAFMERIYRKLGRARHRRTHHLDRLRVHLLAAAGLLPRALRRRSRRQLLSFFRNRTSQAPLPYRVVAGAGLGRYRCSACCAWLTSSPRWWSFASRFSS